MINRLKFQNCIFNKGCIKTLIYDSFVFYGKTRTAFLIDSLKDLGFYYSTKSGLSIGVEDLKVPLLKSSVILKNYRLVNRTNNMYKRGNVDFLEKSNTILTSWSESTNSLTKILVSFLNSFDPFNSLHLMVFSGARGNLSQVIQLMGLRGLMSDPNGHLLDIPIINNFRDGLTLFDYLRSTYGARKGLVDTSLKTADAGFLTRRLVNSMNDIIIKDFDCQTQTSLTIYKSDSYSFFVKQLLGRTAFENLYHFSKNKIIVYKNTCITEKIAFNIFYSSLFFVKVYSVLTCALSTSICKKCYGWDLASQRFICLGSAVGVISAHSIGEPATQLTMRTFHTGGSFTSSPNRKLFSKVNGLIFYNGKTALKKLRTKYGTYSFLIIKPFFFTLICYTNQRIKFFLQQGDLLHVFRNQHIIINTLLAEISVGGKATMLSSLKSLIAPHSGELFLAPRQQLLALLQGSTYEFPTASFINVFEKLKLSLKPYLTFYFKVHSLISGFFSYSLKFDQLCDLSIIEYVHFFIFPIFWDLFILKCVFIGEYNKYFILNDIPTFVGLTSKVFANQKTLKYDTPFSGFLFPFFYKLNRQTSLFKSIRFQRFDSNLILLYVPINPTWFYLKDSFVNSLSNSCVTLSTFQTFIKKVCMLHGHFFYSKLRRKASFVFKFPVSQFSRSSLIRVTSRKLYFPGEILFNIIKINYLTKVDIFKKKNFYFIYLCPFTALSITSTRNIKNFGYLAFDLSFKTLLIPCLRNLDFFIYFGKSFLLLNRSLMIRTPFLRLYSTFLYMSNYLLFKVSINNSFKINSRLAQQSSCNSLRYKMELVPFEFILKSTLIGFLHYQILTFGKYKKLKQNYSRHIRVLLLNVEHFFIFYFESITQLKRNYLLNSYDKFITPFVKFLITGKVSSYGSFSTELHLGTFFYFSPNLQIFHSLKNFIKKGETLGFLYFNQVLTGDIVQGLPKLEEIFELRFLRSNEVYAPVSGILDVTPQSNSITIQSIFSSVNNSSFFVHSGQKGPLPTSIISLTPYSFVSVGTSLVGSSLNFRTILNLLFLYFLRWQTLYKAIYASFKHIQILLIKKIHLIYSKQQITVSLKHFEVLILQLTSFTRIIADSSNSFFVGELIPLTTIVHINTLFRLSLQRGIYLEPIIFGITQLTLHTTSFLASASFQKTTQFLAMAAIEGKIDWLFGVRENIMLGQRLSLGSTFFTK